MIKRIILLAAALLLALACACSAGAESQSQRAVKIKMDLSSSRVQAGDTIHVEISVTNISGADFTEPVTLYYPNGKQIKEFGKQMLKNGESASWDGDWTVTEKQLADGRITFAVLYTQMSEDGTPQNIRLKSSFRRRRKLSPRPNRNPRLNRSSRPNPGRKISRT